MSRGLAQRWAVAIVGGGPAGIATALSLARHAPDRVERVVLLERDRYPREKLCGGAVGERGLRILRSLGVDPDVPSLPLHGIAFTCSEGVAQGRTDRSMGRVVRRTDFDHALVRAAQARGVQVMEGRRVRGVSHLEGGAVVHTSAGDLRARVVVGADGVGSVVRRAMGLSRGLLYAQVLELDTEPVDGDPPRDMLHFDATDRSFAGYGWDFPSLVDGRPATCRGLYHLMVDGRRVDLARMMTARLERRGLDARRYRLKRFAERGFVRRERVADGALMLVGEAAGVDAVSGEGLAPAIEAGAGAGRFLSEVLLLGRAVSDWNARSRLSRVSLDLAVRTRLAAPFYGPERVAMERFMLRHPEVIRLGCQHFAGAAYRPLDLGRVLVAGALRFGRAFMMPTYLQAPWVAGCRESERSGPRTRAFSGASRGERPHRGGEERSGAGDEPARGGERALRVPARASSPGGRGP